MFYVELKNLSSTFGADIKSQTDRLTNDLHTKCLLFLLCCRKCYYYYYYYLSDLCLSTHCRCGSILLHLITLNHTHTHTHTHIRGISSGRGSARRRDLCPYNTQHLQERDIHAPGGIRTRNLRRRAAEDSRLKTARPSGSTVANFLKQNDVTSHADDIITAETSVTTGSPCICSRSDSPACHLPFVTRCTVPQFQQWRKVWSYFTHLISI
jgi:hypothetical protein